MSIQTLIKTEAEYRQTLTRIEHLMDAVPGTSEFDELELLSALVELYEDEHYPMEMPDPISAIQFRLEQLGLPPESLIALIGSQQTVSAVLHREKPLTLTMMRALHKELGISGDVLLQEQATNDANTRMKLTRGVQGESRS
jgi:HTH-type transcriptional regulator/antitoxin HigA